MTADLLNEESFNLELKRKKKMVGAVGGVGAGIGGGSAVSPPGTSGSSIPHTHKGATEKLLLADIKQLEMDLEAMILLGGMNQHHHNITPQAGAAAYSQTASNSVAPTSGTGGTTV